MITCFIRYGIDPCKKDALAEYARNWGQAIPRCSAARTLLAISPRMKDRYRPHRVSIICAIWHPMRPIAPGGGMIHWAGKIITLPRREKCILRAERQFLKIASPPHTELIKP